jgi:hypothetical protein
LLNLQDNVIFPFEAGQPDPISQDRHEEADFRKEREIREMKESDDENGETEEEESSEGATEFTALLERITDGRGDADESRLLSFLIASLTCSMGNDLDIPQDKIDSTVIRAFIDSFYCSPKGDKMVEDIQPRIADQITMWKHFDMDTPNRLYQYVVDAILRIIMIPASEASAERALSRQRLICNDRRVKSHSELLKARYWITDAAAHQ